MRRSWLLLLLLPGLLLAGDFLATLRSLEPKVVATYGERAGRRLNAWQQLIGEQQGQDERAQLSAVNDFFNLFQYVDDQSLWGRNDYWATPIEFIGAAAGDCEDYTIAKYFSLLELGVPEDKMRLTYVKATQLNQYHMVLAYYPSQGAAPLILDNLIGEIKPATERGDLLPIYSFNGTRLWLAKERGRGELVGKSSRLSLWNDLNSRFRVRSLKRPLLTMD
ncbi:transglutaminase-like cysteine peptidase [Gallaecimonas sp. GXIMD4217]|uniref:transglutaminase-like cysteine peptidase n=1 Tax=Gallaecimonas sp. GXIMD4217 TaxID=3131927 RepID=UPI00311AFF7B